MQGVPGQIPGVRRSLSEVGIFAVAAGAGADTGEPEEVCHADMEERTGGNAVKQMLGGKVCMMKIFWERENE